MSTSDVNLLYIFADQWRGQALGYAGDPNVKTPNLDKLSEQSVNFTSAVANCPVCGPARASLITGQYPDRHGMFLNDLHLNDDIPTIGTALSQKGYDTGWIGKWHINGHGRSSFIRPEQRKGFDFWHARECNHDYQNGWYHDEKQDKIRWSGYEPAAQTKEACEYLKQREGRDNRMTGETPAPPDGAEPFALFLSWGPPHNPYQSAPEKYRNMYDPDALILRDNVPPECEAQARKDLAGYYAHCTALDDCAGQLLDCLEQTGLAENTVVVFTSDHGDMLFSQGGQRKQMPYDESILVPFLLRDPRLKNRAGEKATAPFGTVDIMPTLLDLCGADIPATVQGKSFANYLLGKSNPPRDTALIGCYSPFGEWHRQNGGREFRGIRTARYTFVRTLNESWLLFDNRNDPFQQRNLINDSNATALQKKLNDKLAKELQAIGDTFESGTEYIQRWGYTVNENGTIEYEV